MFTKDWWREQYGTEPPANYGVEYVPPVPEQLAPPVIMKSVARAGRIVSETTQQDGSVAVRVDGALTFVVPPEPEAYVESDLADGQPRQYTFEQFVKTAQAVIDGLEARLAEAQHREAAEFVRLAQTEQS